VLLRRGAIRPVAVVAQAEVSCQKAVIRRSSCQPRRQTVAAVAIRRASERADPNTATFYAVVDLGPFLRFGCSLSMASAS
jgi:hypothetical protein